MYFLKVGKAVMWTFPEECIELLQSCPKGITIPLFKARDLRPILIILDGGKI
jgi:hypothetical protein